MLFAITADRLRYLVRALEDDRSLRLPTGLS